MAVKARFWIVSVKKTAIAGGEVGREVVMSAVNRKTDDNIQWAKYTPSGQVTLNVNGPAGQWFEDMLAKDVAVTFEEAE